MKQYERLKEARIEAGFKSGTEAAKHLGVPVATYNTHENGHRSLTVLSAERYAKAFNVRSSWLLTGELPKHYLTFEEMNNMPELPEHKWGKFTPGDPFWGHAERAVPEITAFEAVDSSGAYDVASLWAFPTDFVTNTLGIDPTNLFLVAAPDDSLSPTISEGDRAIADAGQAAFRGDGIYAILDDDGNVHLRHLARIIHKRSPDEEIGIATLKPAQTYFAKLADIRITGKILGKVGRI